MKLLNNIPVKKKRQNAARKAKEIKICITMRISA